MRNYLFLMVSLSFLFLACDDEEFKPGPTFVDINPNDVEIAVKNSSSFKLDSFLINTSGGIQLYETIDRNKKSVHKTYAYSYSYFYMRFKVADVEFINQPIDYVGEKRIENGRYELSIKNVDTSAQSFTFLLEKED